MFLSSVTIFKVELKKKFTDNYYKTIYKPGRTECFSCKYLLGNSFWTNLDYFFWISVEPLDCAYCAFRTVTDCNRSVDVLFAVVVVLFISSSLMFASEPKMGA